MEADEMVQVWVRMRPGDKLEVRCNGKTVWEETCKVERFMEIRMNVLWEGEGGDC